MKKLIANDTEEPSSRVYRLTIVDMASGNKEVKTVSASNPDDAIGRVIDMLSGGLFEPDEFWDKYKIMSIIEELK